MGQAGVNRLHSTSRRIRRQVEHAERTSPPDKNVSNHPVEALSPRIRTSVRSLIPGLAWKTMFSRTALLSYSFAAGDRRHGRFPAAQTTESHLLLYRSTVSAACDGAMHNPALASVLMTTGLESQSQSKNLPAHGCALPEACFTDVSLQPQQFTVPALQKV
jgi:hypothetical protein